MILSDDCEESLSSDNFDIYDSSCSMGSIQETVLYSYAKDVSMEIFSDNTQHGSVIDVFSYDTLCYSIAYP